MIEKINPLSASLDLGVDPTKIEVDSEVKDWEQIKARPAISIGEYQYGALPEPIILGSYGDISCIVGESKSMKSTLKSVFVAGYLGNVRERFADVRSHETKGKYVIELDTEQSPFYVQRMRHNTITMACIKDTKYYKTFRLRRYNPDERFEFLRYICLESQYAGNIGLVILDGAADLLHDTNDLSQSKKVESLLMEITDKADCHLMTILHRTKASKKPTGHIGSSILKKSETVLFVEKEADGIISVKAEYSRGYPVRPFRFKLDEHFMPISEEMDDDIFADT